MLDHDFIVQGDQNPGTFGFFNHCPKPRQKRHHIFPLNIPANGTFEYQFQRFLMLALHGNMVPYNGAIVN